LLEQLGLALGARTHAHEVLRTVLAHRKHEIGADVHVDLADAQVVGRPNSIRCMTACTISPYSSILGRWLAVDRIFDGQAGQIEFRLHLRELLVARVTQWRPTRSSRGARGSR
jgi:hypothetical protein